MKKALFAVTLAAGLAAAAFASPGITLTAPTVTSWTYNGTSANSTALADLNAKIQTAFSQIASDLNAQYNNFNGLADLSDLSKGFANANMAAFDNASLLGYQNYDLFAVSVGFNTSVALPSNGDAAATAVNDLATNGDVYAGTATGGIGAQVGINLGFLVPNLYGSARFGVMPSVSLGSGITAQQGSFGLGVNYALFKPLDFGFGLAKWRGLSVGSGFIYNANTINADVPIDSMTYDDTADFDNGSGTTATIPFEAKTVDTKAKVKITDSSFVIPIDVMTSVQLFWIFNIGAGLGADLNFASTKVSLGTSSGLALTSTDSSSQFTTTNGSASLNLGDSKGNGDYIVPRLAASFGLDLSVLKLDFPVSYYPTTKAFAFGFTGGIVW